MKKFYALLLSFILIFSFGCNGKPSEESTVDVENVKNIILLIGDGMGTEQIKAGNLFRDGGLYMEKIPNKVLTATRSLDSEATDSAASGTAIATGVSTNNNFIGLSPDEDILETIVDIAKKQGKSTGIITTEELSGATPMAFSAHGKRTNYQGLMESAARSGNVDLFVGFGEIEDYTRFTNAGYTPVAKADDISESSSEKIIGAYPIAASAESMTEYSFDRLVFEALEYLSKNENGFFLMAEGAHIDHGGHHNDVWEMINELLAFDLGVKAAVEWAKQRNDTVVLVTADHETGGFILGDKATKDNLDEQDDFGEYINITWQTKMHTGVDVYLYIYGKKINFAEYSSFNDNSRIKNTDIFRIMNSFFSAAKA